MAIRAHADAGVTTTSATNVSRSSATLNGTSSQVGTTPKFEYGTTTGYGSSVAAQSPSGLSQALTATISVNGCTTYHFQLYTTATGGAKTYGGDKSFTTPDQPGVTTGGASGVSTSSATLAGSVRPCSVGSTTTAHFEYGTSTDYGTSTSNDDVGSGTSSVSTSAALSGLSAGTTYHYRLVATNSLGTSYGSDQTFVTSPPPPPPAVTTGGTGSVSSTDATMSALVNPNGFDTSVHFEYGSDTGYGTSVGQRDVGSGTDAVAISASVTGLKPSSTYHYRVVATNANGTTYGDDQALTTLDKSATGSVALTPTPPRTTGAGRGPTATPFSTSITIPATTSSNATRAATPSAAPRFSGSVIAESTPADLNSLPGGETPNELVEGATKARNRRPWVAWALIGLFVIGVGAAAIQSMLEGRGEEHTEVTEHVEVAAVPAPPAESPSVEPPPAGNTPDEPGAPHSPPD
jgi:hypothetical protein